MCAAVRGSDMCATSTCGAISVSRAKAMTWDLFRFMLVQAS